MKITLPIRVIGFETDYAGTVSNTRYLEYMERARYALLHSTKLSVEGILKTHGAQPVVHRVEVDYLGFARHEEELEMTVEVVEMKGAKATLIYELTRPSDGATLLRARQTLAFLNLRWRPVRVPDIYRSALMPESV